MFWSILLMLKTGRSPLALLFQSLLVPLPIFWRLFPAHQLQLVSLSPLCSIVFLVLWQGLDTYLSFRFLLFSLCGPPGRQSPPFGRFSLFFFFSFLLTITRSGRLAVNR